MAVQDGDLDIVYGASPIIAWYENDLTPATGSHFRPRFSGVQHVVSCNATGTRVVRVGDLDHDGDNVSCLSISYAIYRGGLDESLCICAYAGAGHRGDGVQRGPPIVV